MCIKIYYKVLLHSRKMQILATNLDTHMFRLIARIGFFLGWRGRKQIKLGYCWLPATRTISQPSQGTRGNTILLIVSCEGTRQTAKLLSRQHTNQAKASLSVVVAFCHPEAATWRSRASIACSSIRCLLCFFWPLLIFCSP